MTLVEPLVLHFLLNVYVKWVFIFYYIFVLELLFLWRSLFFFCSAVGVTLDKYRTCIGLFNSFRVIRCSDFFRTSFFHYCLKFIMFSISQIFKYFSFSSVNSVAAEFHFFFLHVLQLFHHHAIVGYWSQSWAGWVEELVICLSLEFK